MQESLLRGRVQRRRVGNHPRFQRRKFSPSHRGVGRRKILELRRRIDRGPDLTRTHPQRTSYRSRGVAITLRRMRARIRDALRGLGQHAVDHPPDRTQLVDHPQRLVAPECRRVEPERNRIELRTGGSKRGEHLFVL
jgi:hypothetical protein